MPRKPDQPLKTGHSEKAAGKGSKGKRKAAEKPYDRSVKYVLAGAEPSFATLLLGSKVTEPKPLPTATSRVEWRDKDILLQVVWSGCSLLVHVEFQAGGGQDITARMLRYCADVIATHGTATPLYQAVIYLGDEVPVGLGHLQYRVTEDSYHDYRFLVVSLGDFTWEDILQAGQPKLWALLPLVARQRRQEDPEAYLLACRNKILSSPLPVDERNGVALAASLLAGLVYSDEVVERVFGEVLSMLDLTKSSTYEWLIGRPVEQARQEGLKKGLTEGTASTVLRLLRRRFQRVPKAYADRIRALDLHALERLADAVLEVQSLDDLEPYLNGKAKAHTGGRVSGSGEPGDPNQQNGSRPTRRAAGRSARRQPPA